MAVQPGTSNHRGRGAGPLNRPQLTGHPSRRQRLSPHGTTKRLRSRTLIDRGRLALTTTLLTAPAWHWQAAEPLAGPSGSHSVARLPDGAAEAAIVQAAWVQAFAIALLGAYFSDEPRISGLIFGFAGAPAMLADDVARQLAVAARYMT